MKVTRAIALRVSNLMIKNKMSQYELAARMGTNRTTLKHIIDEEYNNIQFRTILRLADAFDMSIQEFFNDELFKRDNLDID
jgi:DNA-binding Xre family transcriptional regulator